MSEPQRILLVRLSHLGDVVHALPLYHALRESFPSARIAWATQGEFAGLLEGLPGLERTIRFGRRDGALAWLRLRDELQAFAPDLVVDAQGNLKSAIASLCAGAARRVGMHVADRRERLGALASTESAPAARGETPHAIDRMLALAVHVTGREELRSRARFDPGLDAGERARGRELLREHAGDDRGALVLVQLATSGDVRSWPAEHFRELALALARQGRRVLVISGPSEDALGRLVASQLAAAPHVRHWIGQRGLRELASFFTAAAEERALLVSCDSGPMHLAAACGVRVLALAGPQSHLRTGPWPVALPAGIASVEAGASPHRVVRSSSPPACAPCFERHCSHARGPVCMSELAPSLVLDALDGIAG